MLRQFHPFADQLIPIVRFLGPYKRELTAFFANATAATQATTQVGDRRVHYLRTTNPLNPEVLAAFPRRTGSNRANSYVKPGQFTRPGESFPALDDRNCTRPSPTVLDPTDPDVQALLSPELVASVRKLILPQTASGQVPAPPCVLAGQVHLPGAQRPVPARRGAQVSHRPRLSCG